MAVTDDLRSPAPDNVEDVAWNLEPLVEGKGAAGVDELIDRAEAMVPAMLDRKGQVAAMDAAALVDFMQTMSDLQELIGRAASYAGLRFAVDTSDPSNGALMQRVQERATAITTQLIWFELEWAAMDDAAADALLADDRVEPYRYHLQSARRYRSHLLTEPEEKIDAEKDVTGRSAWVRLFSELSAEIKITMPDGTEAPLERGLSMMMHPDRETRHQAADAITAGLAPGLRTRAFIFNTLLADKATDDRLRHYPTWITSRNLANEATDESVEALVDAVKRRYDIPQRWYAMKKRILGLPRLADYDRIASVAASETEVGWVEARDIVLDSYASFSPELAALARRFFDERWIDAPVRAGKRPGRVLRVHRAVSPSVRVPELDVEAQRRAHPRPRARPRPARSSRARAGRVPPVDAAHPRRDGVGVRRDGHVRPPARRQRPTRKIVSPCSRSRSKEPIATVFRQTAMNRFEDAMHTARRDEGELSVDRLGELWAETQTEMLGPAVEITEGYRTWWSYIPHFIGTPGYVYAYAYGQLLALSVYHALRDAGIRLRAPLPPSARRGRVDGARGPRSHRRL